MKILFLTSRFPFPLEKGDKLRAFHQLAALAQRYEVVLCSLTHTHVDAHTRQKIEELGIKIKLIEQSKWQILTNILGGGLFRRLPLSVAYFFNKNVQQKIEKIIHEEQPDVLFAQLIRTSEYFKNIDIKNKKCVKILDLMDAFSVGANRRASSETWYLRWFWRIEAQRLSRYETQIVPYFDQNLIISEQDRQSFAQAERLHTLPNGVDTAFFNRQDFAHQKPDFDLVFVGNMGYYPNVEAAKFLAKTLLPLLQTRIPTARLLLAGARPTAEVRALASDSVEVSGWLNDIREAYARGRVFVAPLFNGSGQQNKILEAMSMSLPCVTTNLVNNAIGATPEIEILTADTGGGLCEAVFKILSDPKFADSVAANGRNFVERQFSWHQSNQELDKLLIKSFENVKLSK